MKKKPASREEEFADNCETIGLFTRRYDGGHKKLAKAADIIWNHLCTLDEFYGDKANKITLGELADCYIITYQSGTGYKKYSDVRERLEVEL